MDFYIPYFGCDQGRLSCKRWHTGSHTSCCWLSVRHSLCVINGSQLLPSCWCSLTRSTSCCFCTVCVFCWWNSVAFIYTESIYPEPICHQGWVTQFLIIQFLFLGVLIQRGETVYFSLSTTSLSRPCVAIKSHLISLILRLGSHLW